MTTIKGKSVTGFTKEEIIGFLEAVTKQRDDIRNANIVINELVGQQYAETQLLKAELSVIKQEIEALYNYRKNGSSN